ncbi:MAG: hypothetical protein WBA89_26535 [Microcoleus sp.]
MDKSQPYLATPNAVMLVIEYGPIYDSYGVAECRYDIKFGRGGFVKIFDNYRSIV